MITKHYLYQVRHRCRQKAQVQNESWTLSAERVRNERETSAEQVQSVERKAQVRVLMKKGMRGCHFFN